ncbi:MAG TPA: efflux RND transporter periplasmic adaptor subunit [Candidatus Sulfotelmatobacter sp.]|nr:efflux RND transporter periplasmic adaptor subunit [Candidatus Sulfotelmatobacter sp.]
MKMLSATRQLGLCLLAALIGVSQVGMIACSATPVTQAATPSTANKAEAASALPAPGSVSQDDDYVASGPIIVENQVDVLALTGGVVSEIVADVGSSVQKGQILARLDDRQALAQRDAGESKLKSCEANLADWEAETKMAEADFGRAQRMRDAGINTQEELDHAHYKFVGSQYEIEKAKRDLDSARDSLRVAELELQKTRIEAPFDGVVARRYVRAGQTAAPGDRMFWVSAVAPLLVKFTLPERFLNRIKAGNTVYVSSLSAPNQSHPARIAQVSPLVDPASDSIDVVAKVEGKPEGLRPGMTANIRIVPLATPQK